MKSTATVVMLVQPSNAYGRIFRHDGGIDISVSDRQPVKAPAPISVTSGGSRT